MKKLFFYKLYLFDRRLFSLLIVFTGLTIFFNIKGDEITPFFIWAMYSEKESTTNNYQVFKIEINDSTLVDYTNDYTDNNKFFLTAPLAYYNKIRQNNFNDPTLDFINRKLGMRYHYLQPLLDKIYNGNEDAKSVTDWYVRYLQQLTDVTINKLTVSVVTCSFTPQNQVQPGSSNTIMQWSRQ